MRFLEGLLFLKGGHAKAMSLLAAVLICECVAGGQTFSVLHTFTGGHDGGAPFAGVAVDGHGNVFGTASGGGKYGQGVIYEINPAGQELILHSLYHTEGSQPWSTPLLTSAGTIYGTTNTAGYVTGTVWELFRSGKLRVLHKFSTFPSDGRNPMAGVVQDPSGNVYGTTPYGGGHGHGTVFKIEPSGLTTDLYSFSGSPDGDSPDGGVVFGNDGELYGATVLGGELNYGSLYKVDARGHESVLHNFNLADGDMPIGRLTTDEDGNLYGTTFLGGPFGAGEVFRVDGAGNLTILYGFGSTQGDARHPYGGPEQGPMSQSGTLRV